MTEIARRRFLAGAAGLLGGTAIAPALPRAAASTATMVPLPGGQHAPGARWLEQENARPGTLAWMVSKPAPPGVLEGFATSTSIAQGEVLPLAIRAARPFRLAVYRMGFYQGLGGRLIAQANWRPAAHQPSSQLLEHNLVSCPWTPTVTLSHTGTWPPGCYLVKLTDEAGLERWIPFTVRDDHSNAAFCFVNAVTTWQAYNQWGGYNLYNGPNAGPGGDTTRSNRARVVSFDRPYLAAAGSGDFFGNEFPVLYQAERYGLDLSYCTSVDLHTFPTRLAAHRCVLSMGHDEYWSRPMRAGVEQAIAAGTNVALLGANFCYRQIRFEPSAFGPDRHVVNYKSAAEDPMTAVHPSLSTVNWGQPPVNEPESLFSGSTYGSLNANDPLVVTNPSAWLWAGTGVRAGTQLPGILIGEYNYFNPAEPGPRKVDVFAHSPIRASGGVADVTYLALPGRGGVLATGAAHWIYATSASVRIPHAVFKPAIPTTTAVLLRAMANVYALFGAGPASTTHPSGGHRSVAP